MSDLDVRPTDATLANAVLILRAIDDTSTTAHQLADVVSADHALSRRLLRLARSPMFGVVADDLTVQRAIVLLGFHNVRTLAVLSAARGLTAGDGDPTRWSSALTTGIATEQLARRAGTDGADGLVAGMLSRLVDVSTIDGTAPDIARVVPAHVVEAMRVDEHRPMDLGAPVLCRLVHAGMAVARRMAEYDPGIPPSSELEAALAATTFPGLADTRLATDIRRGVDLYSGLAD